MCLWDVETHDLVTKLQEHEGRVTGVKYSPDGEKIVTCGHDGIFRVYDANTKMILFEKKTPSEKLTSMIWDWCGKYLFLGTSQGNILIWDLVEVKLVCTTVAHEGKFKYLEDSLRNMTYCPSNNITFTCSE